MADCAEFEQAVSDIEQEIADLEEECRRITNPKSTEFKQCRAAVGLAEDRLARAKQALKSCQAGLPPAGTRAARGHVVFLRVHDTGGFGPQTNFLDAEVIFQLDAHPGRSFGFQLKNDNVRPAHEGMLALLRDAFIHDLDVNVDYRQALNRSNSIAFRVELRRERFQTPVFGRFSGS
jgi:hypothetical protein